MARALIPVLATLLAAAAALGQPLSLSGFSDEGSFVFIQNGERVGTLIFHWKPDGTFENEAVFPKARLTLSITPDAEGRWQTVEIVSPSGRLLMKRDGKRVTVTHQLFHAEKRGEDLHLWLDDKTSGFTMREEVLAFDRDAPALISQALRRYDATKGGTQTFPCRPFTTTRGTEVVLERKAIVERRVGDRELSLVRWEYSLGGILIDVLADDNGRVYLAEIAEQHIVFVRKGFEGLRDP